MVSDQLATAERVRLHITPFNRDLLGKLLPASLQSQASNISFHIVQTFPERGYGYVELPAMEAQKLKTKFNGTTLKGTKVRVEEAKAEKKRKSEQVGGGEEDCTTKKPRRETIKRNPVENVLPGHELKEDRHVKRGWTDKIAKKNGKKQDSKSLKDRKMLFKTTLPPNVATAEAKVKPREKIAKEETVKNRKAKVVVNEFAKSLRPAASKSVLPGKKAVIYEDGIGWLDEDGNLVEAEPSSRKRQRDRQAVVDAPENDGKIELASGSETRDVSDTGSIPEDASSVDDQEDEALQHDTGSVTSTSYSGDDSEEEETSPSHHAASTDSSIDVPDEKPSQTTSQEQNSVSKGIHPLEALYKRPNQEVGDSPTGKRPAPIDTSFSFFNSNDADEDAVQLPQTPHTKRDLEWRSLRSAAPTPDTALPGKRFNFAFDDDEDDAEEDDPEDVTRGSNSKNVGVALERAAKDAPQGEREEESEFRKWFYENRGDLNRGWKKRRREEKKLQRQRENRRLSSKRVV